MFQWSMSRPSWPSEILLNVSSLWCHVCVCECSILHTFHCTRGHWAIDWPYFYGNLIEPVSISVSSHIKGLFFLAAPHIDHFCLCWICWALPLLCGHHIFWFLIVDQSLWWGYLKQSSLQQCWKFLQADYKLHNIIYIVHNINWKTTALSHLWYCY